MCMDIFKNGMERFKCFHIVFIYALLKVLKWVNQSSGFLEWIPLYVHDINNVSFEQKLNKKETVAIHLF